MCKILFLHFFSSLNHSQDLGVFSQKHLAHGRKKNIFFFPRFSPDHGKLYQLSVIFLSEKSVEKNMREKICKIFFSTFSPDHEKLYKNNGVSEFAHF